MRIASATGDEDRVIDAYRRCKFALGELGATPSDSTQQLLGQLRH
jgi:DNA-binding SARP family transcriptional activator